MIDLDKIKDRLIGSGKGGTIKGVAEAAGFAAAVPTIEAVTQIDLSSDAGKVMAILAVWRLIYGLFRK